MDYNIIFLERAENDLDEVLSYKSKFYAGTADRFMDELEAVLNRISKNPRVYQVYVYDGSYRRAVVMDYLLFYRICDDSHTVKIYRVLHGKRDIKECL
ncbi:MAG: type II toxin-antitoxin system RelE/ParE family toxin [Oscillospiraceae bacterium]|nr:type II toxin-antitoxin system RelE/ParE family toxin [Oscillospiraceae bacterium]